MKCRRSRNMLIAFFVAFAVLVANVVVAPQVNAVVPYDPNELEVVYVEYTSNNQKADYTVEKAIQLCTDRKAPSYRKFRDEEDTKGQLVENYFFGGWFREIPDKTLGKEEFRAKDRQVSIKNVSEMEGLEKVYAKFVPAYVLSMKAQNDTEKNGKTTMRMVSSVDSLEYAKVGYTVYVNNRDDQLEKPKTTYVYEKLSVGTPDGSDYVEYEPNQVFGSASRYFITWNYTNIPQKGYDKVIYVQPYWVTWDGTWVTGLSKYLRVEDGNKGYVTVPINLRAVDEGLGSEGKGISAAYMSLDYSAIADKYELVDVTKGRVFHEVFAQGVPRNSDFGEFDSETSVTARKQYLVNMVFNNTNVTQNMRAFDLYACVRFKKRDGVSSDDEIVIGDNNLITFEVKNEAIANANEEVSTKYSVWPVLY